MFTTGSNFGMLEVICQLPSEANVGFSIGLTDSANNAILFNFDTSSDTTVHVACIEGGVTTDTDTATAPGTGVRVYKMVQSAAGTIDFYIDDSLETSISTNVPDAEVMNLTIQLFTRTNAAKSMDVDYVYYESLDLGARTT